MKVIKNFHDRWKSSKLKGFQSFILIRNCKINFGKFLSIPGTKNEKFDFNGTVKI